MLHRYSSYYKITNHFVKIEFSFIINFFQLQLKYQSVQVIKHLIYDKKYLFSFSTKASFIRVVGSEFVQKYLGEGPRMVRDVFRLAKENSPAIIFIDEIDAIATKRFDAQTGG